ncbi:hypothetical protein [Phyllobacterium phragmitis]|uniref:hypothetical protein n=1 Tax=Phyllobacterium phragmitis TaxID=2670329 RepID=UPI001FDF6D37|nr:hypothetical protein [Phyllobacterium phragmitis]
MNWLVTWIFVLIVAWYFTAGILRPEKMYQFPFLAAVMTLGFIIPQLPSLASDPFLPSGAYVKTMLMAILCLVMLRFGWSQTARPFTFLNQTFSQRRLLIAAAFLSIVGAYFYFLLSRLPGEISIGVQMTGTPVVYLFFARLMTYGLAIALLCFTRRPTLTGALIIGFDLIFYFDRIIVTGKRAEALELVMMILLAVWFHRRWIVPRSVMIAGILIGSFFMTSMSDYRQITRANSGPVWDYVLEIDVVGNFEETLKEGGLEMRNAVQRIDEIDRRLEFDYGKFHWNKLVFTFVPAQLVGTSFKDALRLNTPKPERNYQPLTGTTETGFVDAFSSFWYFGAVKFFLLSYLVCRIWKSAMAGGATAQLVYMMSIVPAMHAISHQTDWVVQVWIHMALFLVPILAFARFRGMALPSIVGGYRAPAPQLSWR